MILFFEISPLYFKGRVSEMFYLDMLYMYEYVGYITLTVCAYILFKYSGETLFSYSAKDVPSVDAYAL